MKNSIKQMWVILAAALVMAVGTGCALTKVYGTNGVKAMNQGDYSLAIDEFTKEIKGSPNKGIKSLMYFNRAGAYLGKEDYYAAIGDYNEAIRINPQFAKNPNFYLLRGIANAKKGDYEAAMKDFDSAFKITPGFVAAYYHRGLAYLDKKDYAKAVSDFEAFLRTNPNSKEAKENLEKAKMGMNGLTATGTSAGTASYGGAAAVPAAPAAPAAAPAATPAVAAAPVAKTAAVDEELDIVIRDASYYLNYNIPKGSKIVILNIESKTAVLSDYVINELIANAVNDKNFYVVDRSQLEAIQREQKFQMSGAVDDKDALAIGKFFGAQTIVSGSILDIGSRYRLTIRALSVQTAQVQGQYNRNIAVSGLLRDLAGSVGSRPAVGSAVTSSVAATTQTAAAAQPATTPLPPTAAPAAPPIQGTLVPGGSLSDKLVWLSRSGDSHNTYILEVNADENIASHTFQFSGGINITVVLRGVGGNRTIRLRSHGIMFMITSNVTFILDNNITIQGHSGNNSAMVYVQGGTFKMNAGVTITGNTDYGVYVQYGIFEMNGGTISGNTANDGGGVYNSGTFTMNDGIISGNIANRGGGVYNYGGTFSMRGGIITGNTAYSSGGGVWTVWTGSPFTKTGGTITGYSSDQNNGNVVKDADGYILARKGHAVFVNENTRKETTSGPNANLSYGGSRGTTGAWDQ
jgi:TolB-like protein